MKLDIDSLTLEQDRRRGGWRRESTEERLHLTIDDVPYNTLALDRVFDALPSLMDSGEVTLEFQQTPVDINPAEFFKNHVAIWNNVTRISLAVHGGLSTSTILRLFGNPVVENGEARWPCPGLVVLQVLGTYLNLLEEVVAAILKFLQMRSGAVTVEERGWPTDTVLQIPTSLKRIEAHPDIIELIQSHPATGGVDLHRKRDTL